MTPATILPGSSPAPAAGESLVLAGLFAPVSVVVCACNDEKVLRDCLATCAWCDDIHVADFGSSDGTAEIAAAMGAQVHRRASTTGKPADRDREPTPGDLPLKHPWLFRLNADERFTPELVGRLKGALAKDPSEQSFVVPARVMFMERRLRGGARTGSHQVRLIDTRRSTAGDPGVAQGRLYTPILHYPFAKGMHAWLDRCNRRTGADAEAIFRAMGTGASVDRAIAPHGPWSAFFRAAFLELGILDGLPGLTYSILRAFREYQVKLKLLELRAGGTPVVHAQQAERVRVVGTETRGVAGMGTSPASSGGPVLPGAGGLPPTPAERFGSLVTPGTRVIVTGASGFIGTNLVEYFRRAGAEVINIDVLPPQDPAHTPNWRNVDICQAEPYTRAVRDFEPEYFFHLAARTDLGETLDIGGYAPNTVGVENTLKALEGLKSIKRLIVTSSQLVCRPGYTPTNDEDYAPHTIYGQSKVMTERITRAWKNPSCPWTLIRPTSIWGPWFRLPYKAFFLAVAGRKYMHQRGVNAIRSFGFVGNGAYEYMKMALADAGAVDRRTFYLSDEPIRVREWADMVQREMGVAPLREMPLSVLIVAAKVGDALQLAGWKDPPLTSFRLRNMTGNNTSDMSPVFKIIGPMPYTVEEGVKVTVDWMRREGSIP